MSYFALYSFFSSDKKCSVGCRGENLEIGQILNLLPDGQKFKNQLCSDQMRKAGVTSGEPTAEMVNILLLELKDLFEELDEDMAFYFGKANMPTDVPKEKSIPQEYQCEVEYDL